MSARPVYFGPSGRLFGWWEAPRDPPRGVAVITDSVGYDSMCTHWAFRRLSEKLCLVGLAVLRVDLAGTGDSDDLPANARVVEGWKASLHQAADTAQAWSGNAPLALVGLRLGATLAAAVGAERTDVEALALLDPSPQGRTWFREQKALALTSGLGIGKPSVEEASTCTSRPA